MNHLGFKSVQASIAQKEGVSAERAGAMLASSTSHASTAAHKANPRLNRVPGGNQFHAQAHSARQSAVVSAMARDLKKAGKY